MELRARPAEVVTTAFLESACKKGAPLFAPVDITLKGKEARLPAGWIRKATSAPTSVPDGICRHGARPTASMLYKPT